MLFGASLQVVPMATPAQVSGGSLLSGHLLGYLILELPTLSALVLWIWKQRGPQEAPVLSSILEPCSSAPLASVPWVCNGMSVMILS